jgi:hypothetical protein
MYDVILRCFRVTITAVEKQKISIIYFECVFVALGIQHANRMRLILLSSMAYLFLLYFSTLSHKRHDLRKKLLNIKCVF